MPYFVQPKIHTAELTSLKSVYMDCIHFAVRFTSGKDTLELVVVIIRFSCIIKRDVLLPTTDKMGHAIQVNELNSGIQASQLSQS